MAKYNYSRRNELATERIAALKAAGHEIKGDSYSAWRKLPADVKAQAIELVERPRRSGKATEALLRAVRGSTQVGRASKPQISRVGDKTLIETRRADTIRSQLVAAGTDKVKASLTGRQPNGNRANIELWGKGGWAADKILKKVDSLIQSGEAINIIDAFRLMASDVNVAGSVGVLLQTVEGITLTI